MAISVPLRAPYRYLYERRTFYLATDSSLKRVIARSPQKEHDILKAIGASVSEEIVISSSLIFNT